MLYCLTNAIWPVPRWCGHGGVAGTLSAALHKQRLADVEQRIGKQEVKTARATTLHALLTTIFVLGVAMAAHADTVLVKTTFGSDLGGWTSNTPSEVTWQATGGNPNGVAAFNDQSSAGTYLDAPARFLSPAIPYSTLSGKAYISWQHKIGKQANVESVSPYEIRLSGPGGSAKFDGSVPPITPQDYQTVVAPLQEADWTVTMGTWKGLLANVTDMQIDIELVTNNGNNNDLEFMDNIEIVSHPSGFSPGAK